MGYLHYISPFKKTELYIGLIFLLQLSSLPAVCSLACYWISITFNLCNWFIGVV